MTPPSPIPPEVLAALRADIVPVAIGLLLCGLAFGAGLILVIRRRGDATLLSFASFAALYGIQTLCDSYAFELLSGLPDLPREILSTSLTYILPVPVILFIVQLLGKGWRSSLLWLWRIQLAFAVIAIPVEALLQEPEALMGVYRVLILFPLLPSLAHLFWPGQEKTSALGGCAGASWSSRDGRIEELTQPGIVMGRLHRAVYTEASAPFEPGDCLLLFTDGIPEAASPAGEQFGDARLQELLAERAGSSAETVAGNLIERVERWTGRSAGFEDDLTLVVVEYRRSQQLTTAGS